MTAAVATPGRLVRRLDPAATLRRTTTPRALLAVAMVAYATFYIGHLTLYHDRFWTVDYDLGIFDQSAWLLSRGHDFITIRGLSFWGHHVNPAMVLFIPFYWLGAGPRFLNAVTVLSLTTGAVAVFRLAVHYTKREWLALPLAVAFLLHTASQYVLHETFHPEVVAIAPMLFAYLAVVEGRWVAFRNWIVFAVLWKEDVAITAAMFGLVLFFRGHRKQGAWTFALSVTYYLFATKVLLPAFSPGDGAFYAGFLGNLGDSPQALLHTAVTHPTRFTDQLDRANAVGYFRDLAQPYAFIPFVSPIGILIGLPQAILNLLTIHGYSWSIRWHYVSMPLFGFTVSLVEGVARLQRLAQRARLPDPKRAVGVVCAGVFACALVMSYLWSPSYGRSYRENWPLFADPRRAVLHEAVAMVPRSVATAASYQLVPHLAHRERIYTFPNPWIVSYWGMDVRTAGGATVVLPHPDDPAVVRWIAVDESVLAPNAVALLVQLKSSGEWIVHLDRDGVVVLERR